MPTIADSVQPMISWQYFVYRTGSTDFSAFIRVPMFSRINGNTIPGGVPAESHWKLEASRISARLLAIHLIEQLRVWIQHDPRGCGSMAGSFIRSLQTVSGRL